MKRKRNNMLKGSYTVEAAIVVPTIMFALLLFFYFALLLYNRVVLQAAAIRGAKQIHYAAGSDYEEIRRNCEATSVYVIQGRCVGTDTVSVDSSVGKGGSKVTLLTKQETIHLIPEIFETEGMWEIEMYWEESRQQPEELFRTSRKYLLYGKLIKELSKEGES